MKPVWILVANTAHARIFSAESASSALAEVEDLSHPASRLLDHEITTDQPGKIKSSTGVGHAFEQPTDPKQHEAEIFAQQVSGYLEVAFNANKFGQLMIVAEPSFLGLLRHHLPDHVRKQVVFELDKNITQQSVAEIRGHLPEFF